MRREGMWRSPLGWRGVAVALGLAVAQSARAAVVPPPGYIYDRLLLGSETQSCVAVGPGGTFVGVGPGFSANAQAVVLVAESGAARLVAFGFNSIGDCAYDAARDVLYVTDNADAGELPGALSGDTVFAVPSASTAPARSASGLEVLPPNSVPNAASVAVDAAGNVFVSDAAGSGAGTVMKIDPNGPSASVFASGFDFTSGLALQPGSGDVFVAEATASFASRIRRFSPAGVDLGVFAGPSFDFGSYDLAFHIDGRLLATGLFGGDVVALDASGSPAPFASGLTFATGVAVNSFTGRVEILSGFSGTDDDRAVHRFVPVSRLVAGRGRSDRECLHEFYGVELVPPAPGKPPRDAICQDGAPCDADGVANDRCLFPLGFCLNAPDPNLPDCAADTIAAFEARATAAQALVVTETMRRVGAQLPLNGPACFFTDGVPVPVRATAEGKKKGVAAVRVRAATQSGRADRDAVRLVCNPA